MSYNVKNDKNTGGYDPRVIANYLLDWGERQNIDITQMKLLKLFYFCYGYYLLEKSRPLTKNDFEAWEYGPVSRSLRKEFGQFKARKITSRAFITDIFTGESRLADPTMVTSNDRTFLNNILEIYGKYSGPHLSNLTHEKGSPWDIIWNGREKRARIGLRITDTDILNHFNH